MYTSCVIVFVSCQLSVVSNSLLLLFLLFSERKSVRVVLLFYVSQFIDILHFKINLLIRFLAHIFYNPICESYIIQTFK